MGSAGVDSRSNQASQPGNHSQLTQPTRPRQEDRRPACHRYERFYLRSRAALGRRFHTLHHGNRARDEGVRRYAWGVPSAAAMQCMVRHIADLTEHLAQRRNASARTAPANPAAPGAAAAPAAARAAPRAAVEVAAVIDFGAGSGYWASVLQRQPVVDPGQWNCQSNSKSILWIFMVSHLFSVPRPAVHPRTSS